MAYYVPRARKLPMLPKGWVEKSQSSQTEEEAMILPAFFNLAESMRIDAPSPTQSTPDARRAPKSPVDADLYSVLNSIQVIKFRRPLINPGTNDRRIFGSVLVEEIVEAFKQDHGVIVAPSSVKIAARIKEVGSHDISVALPGSERSIKLTVIVEPE
ncbi:hypothetical protein HK101_003199 [Irineochytrium annulatum]|nr:hypothetical protein HK101_003199 [Irineochytrium annulatum]